MIKPRLCVVVLCAPVHRNKKTIQTKYRMPLFNWQALKPDQVEGTVFKELDDEHVLGVRGQTGLLSRGQIVLYMCPPLEVSLSLLQSLAVSRPLRSADPLSLSLSLPPGA